MKEILVAPSLLACDFGRMAEEIQAVQNAGADWLHVDVMDGHFVPNLSMGPGLTKFIARESRTFVDVHLMVEYPQDFIEAFVKAGAEALTVHIESKGLAESTDVRSILSAIRETYGLKAGLSVRPRTSIGTIKPYLDLCDLVLIMSVEPGFGGQSFMPEVLDKIQQLREIYQGHISVDGGITVETGEAVRKAGADVLVAGTTIFKSDSYANTIRALRGEA